MENAIENMRFDLTDETEEAFVFYEDACRATLPDMVLVSSADFRRVAFIACDEPRFMETLRDGKHSLKPAYVPRSGNLPPRSILEAIARTLRARVEAIRSNDPSLYLASNMPIPSLMIDETPPNGELERWIRGEHIRYIRHNPDMAGLHLDEFRKQMIHILSMSGDVVKIHRNGRSRWRLTKKFKKLMRQN